MTDTREGQLMNSVLILLQLAVLIAQAFGFSATLREAPKIQLPCPDDCNSPAFFNSAGHLVMYQSDGRFHRTESPDIEHLNDSCVEAPITDNMTGGRWIESTWVDEDKGVIYGWYHNEPGYDICAGRHICAPRIGAIRSTDDGKTWEDLGVVLEARYIIDCSGEGMVGGNGDFCVIPDDPLHPTWLYFFHSAYSGEAEEQGVAVARISYEDLERPIGKVMKWCNGSWSTFGYGGMVSPIYPVKSDWRKPHTDAMWGPSVHWNTFLEAYVMLLNHANESDYTMEGVYIAYSPGKDSLNDPDNWSKELVRIQDGLSMGGFYPQVIGASSERGTDKIAGQVARYFVDRGLSNWEIVFSQ